MNIAGFQKFSTVDWPGTITLTVFLQGCPLRCEYCFSSQLQDTRVSGYVTWDEVLAYLRKRASAPGRLLDGVVFSGGEVLRQSITAAVRDVRDLGLGVGLHTTGVFPQKLEALIDEGLVDWVGLDVKTSDAGAQFAWPNRKVIKSIELLETSLTDYEIRCTVTPERLDEGEEIYYSVRGWTRAPFFFQKAERYAWDSEALTKFRTLPGYKRGDTV